jgi:hypothetical protein
VAAYTDFYRPKYGILENVMAMAKMGKKGRDENVLSQLICAIVGMVRLLTNHNLLVLFVAVERSIAISGTLSACILEAISKLLPVKKALCSRSANCLGRVINFKCSF